MTYSPYTLLSRTQTAQDTFIYRFKPVNTPVPSFKSGQYICMQNPAFSAPLEAHAFSLASSPTQHDFVEFCIKTYGEWTKALVQLQNGQTVLISQPTGNYVWNDQIQHAVFLTGGIGIAPIMSMLRYIREAPSKPQSLILLYGTRSPETTSYHTQLVELQEYLPMLKVITIYSHLPIEHTWKGYRGFITPEIVTKEVDLTKEPTFFFVGPPIFIEKMDLLLANLSVPQERRRKEDFSKTLQG